MVRNARRTAAMIVPLGVVFAGVLMIAKFREPFPYTFEIVRLSGGRLGIVNREEWNTRDLDVRLASGGEVVAKGMIDHTTHSAILSPPRGMDYGEIVVRRTDVLGRLKYSPKTISIPAGNQPERFIVLVGASIGQRWNLPEFAARSGVTGYAYGFRGKYEFDKSDVLATMTRYRIKPAAVIIKECSAYFPRDLEGSKGLLERWVRELQASSILPVLATAAPVVNTPEHQQRQRSVDEWNRYVRQLASDKGVPALDLAHALQVSPEDTHLNPEFAEKDGLHLNEKAYGRALDPLLKDFLLRLRESHVQVHDPGGREAVEPGG